MDDLIQDLDIATALSQIEAQDEIADEPVRLHSNDVFTAFKNNRHHYIEFNRCKEGAVIIPRFANGDFLLVRLGRAPIFDMSIEFPRGGIEPLEAIEAGALRELLEETGYRIDVSCLSQIGSVGPDTATMNMRMHVFLANIPDGVEPGAFDTHEIEAPIRMTEEDLRGMIASGEIYDGQTLSAYALWLCAQ